MHVHAQTYTNKGKKITDFGTAVLALLLGQVNFFLSQLFHKLCLGLSEGMCLCMYAYVLPVLLRMTLDIN